jgi:hypothetical protein
VANLIRHPLESFYCLWNQNAAVVYFYSATSRGYRGAMWSIFTPALIIGLLAPAEAESVTQADLNTVPQPNPEQGEAPPNGVVP